MNWKKKRERLKCPSIYIFRAPETGSSGNFRSATFIMIDHENLEVF